MPSCLGCPTETYDLSELDMLASFEPRLVEPLLTCINRDLAEKVLWASSQQP